MLSAWPTTFERLDAGMIPAVDEGTMDRGLNTYPSSFLLDNAVVAVANTSIDTANDRSSAKSAVPIEIEIYISAASDAVECGVPAW